MAEMQPLDVAFESLRFVTDVQGAAEEAPPPTDLQVVEVESALERSLPPSYVSFMQRAGKILLQDWDLYWIGDADMSRRNLLIANEIEREHDESPLPKFLIAFCDDGNGDQYCFDTRHKRHATAGEGGIDVDRDRVNADPDAYPVVLWDRDHGQQQIEDGLYVVAGNFMDWLKTQIHEST